MVLYSAVPLKRSQLFHKHSQNTSHSSPVRTSYGVSDVDLASGWYSASVPEGIYVISYNIGPRYNGTRLYSVNSAYQTDHLSIYIPQRARGTCYGERNWWFRSRIRPKLFVDNFRTNSLQGWSLYQLLAKCVETIKWLNMIKVLFDLNFGGGRWYIHIHW